MGWAGEKVRGRRAGLPLRLYEVVLKVSDEKEHAPLTSGCSVPPSRPASCAVWVSTSTVTALIRQAEPSGGAAPGSNRVCVGPRGGGEGQGEQTGHRREDAGAGAGARAGAGAGAGAWARMARVRV